ncbi:MAG: protocatechuate 3,4-dioxygenase subunit alpha [Pseudonocardia sp.]
MSTPGQTIGPFFAHALPYPGGPDLVPPGSPGAIRLHGRVLDGHGAPVPDALLEIRQAGPDGRVPQEAGSLHRDGWTFTGWGRAATDDEGRYAFTTLEPRGFVAMTVFARGLLDALFTRVYPPGATDPFLDTLPPQRRATLLARMDAHGLRFDVVLQGAAETVFLAHR